MVEGELLGLRTLFIMSLTDTMRRDRSGIVDVGAVLGERKPLRRLGDDGSTIANVCKSKGRM